MSKRLVSLTEDDCYIALYGDDLYYCVPHYVTFYSKKLDGGEKIKYASGAESETWPCRKR